MRIIRTLAVILMGLLSTAAMAASAESAVQHAAETEPLCRSIGAFHWEIGNAKGVLASGQVGDEYSADKVIDIASASKFIWGAYIVQKLDRNQAPSAEQVSYLEMKSGYVKFNPLFCLLSKSVRSCLEARSNDERDTSAVGRFWYGGGHDQHMAASMGLGRYSARQLTDEVMGTLGLGGLDIEYKRPLPAGGLEASPAAYGKFLRKVVAGELRYKQYLGYKPVCAYQGDGCDALSTPVQEHWHYSLNHWIEDDPATGDGAYSSPGLLGFYPWISADKSTYGLLARRKLSKTAYWDSVQCGRKLRAAWMHAR